MNASERQQQQIDGSNDYYEHELACNIAEDMDDGHIFPWRLDEVKAHLARGGTTKLIDGELCLVMPNTLPAWYFPRVAALLGRRCYSEINRIDLLTLEFDVDPPAFH